MKITNDIIQKTRLLSNLPTEKINEYLQVSTGGFYKKWIEQAEQLLKRGERVISNEEILLLEFYEAYKLCPLQRGREAIKSIEELNDPKAQIWLEKVSHVTKSIHQDIAELAEKLNRVRPPR